MTQYLPYVLIAAVIAWLTWELWNAPAGWQDSDGFHYNRHEGDEM